MSFLIQRQLAEDPDFKRRVVQAVVNAAIAISAETPTADTPKRRAFGTNALSSPDAFGAVVAVGVAALSTITFVSTDTEIQDRVNAIWNAYAGV